MATYSPESVPYFYVSGSVKFLYLIALTRANSRWLFVLSRRPSTIGIKEENNASELSFALNYKIQREDAKTLLVKWAFGNT